MIAEPADSDVYRDTGPPPGTVAAGTVAAIDTVLLAAFDDRVLGDDAAKLEDADQVGQLLDLDHPPSAIRNAVEVAIDGDEAIVG